MTKINNQNFKEETVLEIGKFAVLWNIFENEKCQNDCDNSHLIELANGYEASKDWKNFAAELQERAKLNDTDSNNYVDNELFIGRGRREKLEIKNRVKEFINSNGSQNLAGGLVAIYRIRNNMFHGLKDRSSLDNQIDLFKAINTVLEKNIK